MTHELLAQVIDEIAVLAADHRRKKPRKPVPRPAWLRPVQDRPVQPWDEHLADGGGRPATPGPVPVSPIRGRPAESNPGIAMFQATSKRIIKTA